MSSTHRGARPRALVCDTTLAALVALPGAEPPPGAAAELAAALAHLGVDVIEAGRPATPAATAAIRAAAEAAGDTPVAACTGLRADGLTAAWEAVDAAARPRVHVHVPASDARLRHELRMSAHELAESATSAVRLARRHVPEVHVVIPDATAANRPTLLALVDAVAAAGASGIRLGDAGGATLPADLADLVAAVREAGGEATIAVRPSDELGLASACALAALDAGAGGLDGAIGADAGGPDAPLATIAALLAVHAPGTLGLRPDALASTRRLAARIGGRSVAPLADGSDQPLDLGAHAGRHALRLALEGLGHEVDGDELRAAYRVFRGVAVGRRTITADELEAVAADRHRAADDRLQLASIDVRSASGDLARATIALADDDHGTPRVGTAEGVGPVDALFRALAAATELELPLADYAAEGVGRGADTLVEVRLHLRDGDARLAGQALGADVLDASARAWLRAAARATANLPAPEPLEQPSS